MSNQDPRKHHAFIVREASPLNGGPPLALLCRSMLTPAELFFVRSHAPTPVVDPDAYRFTVGGLVEQPLTLSLADLGKRFTQRTLVATLQCAGNRRQELLSLGDIPEELPWGEEAISTAVWEGVALRDVLAAARVQSGGRQVEFLGLDQITARNSVYGSSIPLDKAQAGDVLLAHTMNGGPLPLEHGFPLRVVVPGYLGARSVKWLGAINILAEPSRNYYQARAYKLHPGHVTQETVNWEAGIMLGEMPVTSIICDPAAGQTVRSPMCIRGLAFTSGGRSIVRVDISPDGGRNWTQAALEPEASPWAWRVWSIDLALPPGEHELVARAWDSAGNTQPEHLTTVWNFKGYYNNAWHRVCCRVAA